jgi:hypothetical protein
MIECATHKRHGIKVAPNPTLMLYYRLHKNDEWVPESNLPEAFTNTALQKVMIGESVREKAPKINMHFSSVTQVHFRQLLIHTRRQMHTHIKD